MEKTQCLQQCKDGPEKNLWEYKTFCDSSNKKLGVKYRVAGFIAVLCTAHRGQKNYGGCDCLVFISTCLSFI